MAKEYIHGGDMTDAHAMRMFRKGREMVTISVFKNHNDYAKGVVRFLTYKDVSKRPRKSMSFDCWNADEVLRVVTEESAGPWLPLDEGDEIRWYDNKGDHTHTITAEDLHRGYVVCGTYMGVRSGLLERPCFIQPRTQFYRGDVYHPSRSVLAE